MVIMSSRMAPHGDKVMWDCCMVVKSDGTPLRWQSKMEGHHDDNTKQDGIMVGVKFELGRTMVAKLRSCGKVKYDGTMVAKSYKNVPRSNKMVSWWQIKMGWLLGGKADHGTHTLWQVTSDHRCD